MQTSDPTEPYLTRGKIERVHAELLQECEDDKISIKECLEKMIRLLEWAKGNAISERAGLREGKSPMDKINREINAMFQPVPRLEDELERIIPNLKKLLAELGPG
ncbi:MAG: hypothetical protein ACPG4T_23760 [Nannocystaceae bacterium]